MMEKTQSDRFNFKERGEESMGTGILGIGIIIAALDLALRILGIIALCLFIRYMLKK
nr:hypothetical protein [uncultured Caproiciproducens sp.]